MSLSYYFSLSKPNLKFLVIEIISGIAGFTVEQIAPLFNKAIDENIENMFLPESFYNNIDEGKNTEPLTRVLQKWRFNAPHQHLW